MKKIEFLDLTETGFDSPKPALTLIPDWYKKHSNRESYDN